MRDCRGFFISGTPRHKAKRSSPAVWEKRTALFRPELLNCRASRQAINGVIPIDSASRGRKPSPISQAPTRNRRHVLPRLTCLTTGHREGRLLALAIERNYYSTMFHVDHCAKSSAPAGTALLPLPPRRRACVLSRGRTSFPKADATCAMFVPLSHGHRLTQRVGTINHQGLAQSSP